MPSTEREMEFLGPTLTPPLLARRLGGSERLGECFGYGVTLYCESPNVRAEQVLGQPCGVALQVQGEPKRYFHGIACEFAHTGRDGRYAVYRLLLRPWLWLLSQNRQCRVFQHRTPLEIALQIFREWRFSADVENRLEGGCAAAQRAREYCVQYNESDLNFVQRLLEDEGVYYYFKHEPERHVLVLANGGIGHDTVPGFESLRIPEDPRVPEDDSRPDCRVLSWTSSQRVRAGRVTLRDYDFQKPRVELLGCANQPGSSSGERAEQFEYPGEFTSSGVGEERARVRLEDVRADIEVSDGTTDVVSLHCGARFALIGHRREAENRQYLITALRHDVDMGAFESGATSQLPYVAPFQAVAVDTPYRSGRVTPRPIIPGVQTATVVGKKGSEIWTDEYGRVKVQFHWDREGQHDETSSCWVRVAQLWTGNKWGSLHIPRVGQEVVVEFMDGNPDRPLVTGCVYNFDNRPPFLSGGSDQPAHHTQSGFRTHSTSGGNPNEANALIFDDERGKEQVVVRAQRDMTTQVGHDESHTVQGKLALVVEEGEYVTDVRKGKLGTYVHQNLYELTAKQIQATAAESISHAVAGSRIIIEQQSLKLESQGASVLLDRQGVTLAVGESTIVLDGKGITITKGASTIRLDGIAVHLNS